MEPSPEFKALSKLAEQAAKDAKIDSTGSPLARAVVASEIAQAERIRAMGGEASVIAHAANMPNEVVTRPAGTSPLVRAYFAGNKKYAEGWARAFGEQPPKD